MDDEGQIPWLNWTENRNTFFPFKIEALLVGAALVHSNNSREQQQTSKYYWVFLKESWYEGTKKTTRSYLEKSISK